MIITKVILPLVETCADVGAQVVAGSRHSVGEVDLLAAFGESMHKLDLDDPALFCDDDLAAYALATLRLEGNERDGNPSPMRPPPGRWLPGSQHCRTVTSWSPG